MSSEFYISTEKSKLDIDFINEFVRNSYWGRERTEEQTMKTIENSLCFGMYTESKRQIGFGRIVTDYAFFGYFMDIIISESHQGKGLGKFLIEYMLNEKIVKGLQTVALKTKDAHSLYEKYGFKKIGDSSLWMSIDRQNLE